jgi:hypothetical protein
MNSALDLPLRQFSWQIDDRRDGSPSPALRQSLPKTGRSRWRLMPY